MEIVYYRTSAGRMPVKEYLSKYDLSKPTDMKNFTRMESTMVLAAENGGIAGGELSAPLKDHKFQEFRFSESEKLVRILYFAFRDEQIVLLNIFDKPKLYEKGKKRKVELKIEATMQETDGF